MILSIDIFDIEYDYHEGEGATYDCPGQHEEVEIYSVIHKDVEMIEYISEAVLEGWKETILEHLEATKYD